MNHPFPFSLLARVTGVCVLLAIPAISGTAKVVTEKDPVTGEIRMRSVPDDDGTASAKPASRTAAPKAQAAAPRKSTGRNAAEAESPLEPRQQALLVVGLVLCVVGGFWTLVRMAQVSVLWLIAGLLVSGIAVLVFLFVHFREARAPFIVSVAGWIVLYFALRG